MGKNKGNIFMLGIFLVFFIGYLSGSFDSDNLFCIKGGGNLYEYDNKNICIYPETSFYYIGVNNYDSLSNYQINNTELIEND